MKDQFVWTEVHTTVRNESRIGAIPRLAVVADFLEEGWPSMDLVAEMLCQELKTNYEAVLSGEYVCARYHRRVTRLPGLGGTRFSMNVDRILNRMWDYPRFLRRRRTQFDLFHIADHSYSQLVHALPADRTGVYCHDLDAFRCLLDRARYPRPRWFRALARRV